MHLPWFWIPLGALTCLVVYQQFRLYWIHRAAKKQEELFQIVTENAADMIALVDVKGRRLYNSPAYKRILGYSAAELGKHLRSIRSIPTTGSTCWRPRAKRAARESEKHWTTASATKTGHGG